MTRKHSSASFVRLTLVIASAIAFCLAGATTASAITRAEVLSRAQVRVDRPVPYSQAKYYAGYRTDCSGYVSMCWATGMSYSTRSFYLVTHPIRSADLRPGDAMLKKGYHIRLFYGWYDAAKTQYVAYESSSGKIAGVRIHSFAEDIASGYVPVRYDRISNGTTSPNVLRNPSFDTWAYSWSVSTDQPVWWASHGTYGQAVATRRKDTYYSARNSLRLANASSARSMVTGISQAASVTPEVKYRLTSYAKTACDPSGLEMRVTCMGPSGEILSDTPVTADRFGVGPTGYKKMSLMFATPANATSARVAFSLAGGTSADASGNPVAGTSAFIDHISLERPRMAVGMNAGASSFYVSKRITLSGSVAPTSSIGTTATVYVKRPGSSTWKRVSSVEVTASGTIACWRSSYYVSRSSPRGIYYFKTVVPGVDGWLPGTSRIASVRKR